MGLLILLGCAVLASVVFHLSSRNFALACVLSGATASVVLTLLDTYRRGHPDKFAPIALLVGTLYGVVVSVGVGGILRMLLQLLGRK